MYGVNCQANRMFLRRLVSDSPDNFKFASFVKVTLSQPAERDLMKLYRLTDLIADELLVLFVEALDLETTEQR